MNFPKHIAIIMDGNGRWAKKRCLPRQMGHTTGIRAARLVIELCIKQSIPTLTLFAFGHDNWKRPLEEVEHLFSLFIENLQKELPALQKNQVRLYVVGERDNLNETLQKKIEATEKATQTNQKLQLILAINYSGQWDICQAMKQILNAYNTKIFSGPLDQTIFSKYLSTSPFPDPDLLIRTSGEQRISNFFLWQLAYTELYFTEVLWPDFDETEFNKALAAYNKRTRRFGLTDEQYV